MATTFANDRGTTGHAATEKESYFLSEVVDFSATTHVATDIFQALNVPAGSIVLNAGIDVLVVDTAGNSGTIALGDGTVVYIATAIPTTLGNMANGDAVAEMFVPYTAADTLDVTVSTGAVNGKVRVWAIVTDYTKPNTDELATFTAV